MSGFFSPSLLNFCQLLLTCMAFWVWRDWNQDCQSGGNNNTCMWKDVPWWQMQCLEKKISPLKNLFLHIFFFEFPHKQTRRVSKHVRYLEVIPVNSSREVGKWDWGREEKADSKGFLKITQLNTIHILWPSGSIVVALIDFRGLTPNDQK